MTTPYDLDESVEVGDPGHTDHHENLAKAVNDLDSRVSDLESIEFPVAGLDRVGLLNAVIIENGAELPVGLPTNTLVLELEE